VACSFGCIATEYPSHTPISPMQNGSSQMWGLGTAGTVQVSTPDGLSVSGGEDVFGATSDGGTTGDLSGVSWDFGFPNP
jgi:hypothetical protein